MLKSIVIETPDAVAHVYTHGAHLTHYQRRGEKPLLFLSEKSPMEPGKPIRGGVPIVFPWFGKNPNPSLPIHGFARTQEWQVESSARDSLTLLLTQNETTKSLWPFNFELRHTVTIGETLTMTLAVRNTNDAPIQFDNGLHSYFAVGDVREIQITGLQGATYLDKTKSMQRQTQSSEILRITDTIDSVYTNTTATCVIDDPMFRRKIRIEKKNSNTTVVWNPWSKQVKNFADLGPDDWRKFICVETANASDNRVTLPPDETHVMSAIVSVQGL
jgi:glucose-6-phosphate 1-epimerase